jgi:hypothetical protein
LAGRTTVVDETVVVVGSWAVPRGALLVELPQADTVIAMLVRRRVR